MNNHCWFDHPTSIIFDPMSNTYAADMFNQRIQLFLVGQSSGTIIAQNSSTLYFPVSMIPDSQLNLYVADSYNQRLQKFSDIDLNFSFYLVMKIF
jgi:hypothetical protein